MFSHLCSFLSPEWIVCVECLRWFTQHCSQSWPERDLEDGVSTCDNLKGLNRQLVQFAVIPISLYGTETKGRSEQEDSLCPRLSSRCFKWKPAGAGSSLLTPAYSRCSTDTGTLQETSVFSAKNLQKLWSGNEKDEGDHWCPRSMEQQEGICQTKLSGEPVKWATNSSSHERKQKYFWIPAAQPGRKCFCSPNPVKPECRNNLGYTQLCFLPYTLCVLHNRI